jgi:hypothetical protein
MISGPKKKAAGHCGLEGTQVWKRRTVGWTAGPQLSCPMDSGTFALCRGDEELGAVSGPMLSLFNQWNELLLTGGHEVMGKDGKLADQRCHIREIT